MKQLDFQNRNWKHQLSHGGDLRKARAGRGARPLSTKDPLHLVFKVNQGVIRGGLRSPQRFSLIHKVLKKYSKKFYIKVEQASVQGDHIHFLIRTTRRSNYQSFFRVLAGQIAQRFENEGLLGVTDTPSELGSERKPKPKFWKHRPFSRVVRGWRAYKVVQAYIKLNELEARGLIPYQKARLRGLLSRIELERIFKRTPSSGG